MMDFNSSLLEKIHPPTYRVYGIQLSKLLGLCFSLGILTSCGGDGFSSLDNSSALEGIGNNGPCDIASVSPDAASPLRMPTASNTGKTFLAVPTTNTCIFTFQLNGTTLGSPSANPSASILPAQLTAGQNTLLMTASDGTHTKTVAWTILRNNPPTCASQVPANRNNSIGVSSTINLTAYGSDVDNDPVTISWLDNGTPFDPATLQVFTATGASFAAFTPKGTQSGMNAVQAVISDGYDKASCAWDISVVNNCSLASFSPTPTAPRVSAVGSTSNTFIVIPNDSTCQVSWELNGVARPADTSLTNHLNSSNFLTGNNTLIATLTNGTSLVTKTWYVYKNTPPACASQIPNASGNTVNVGSPITFNATGSDVDGGDSLSFIWQANNAPVNTSFFTTSTPGPGQGQTIFVPTSAFAGNNTVSAIISDGLDASTCTWNLSVINNCAFVSGTPAAGSLRVSNVGTASNPFVVTTNDSSCNLSWKLNGVDLGNSTALLNLLSSQLQPGTNTLIATAANSLSTISKSWNVNKNTPPVCASQTPAPSGSSVASGGNLSLLVNATDANSDPLSFSWLNNGTSVSAPQFTLSTPAANASQAVFNPTSIHVGSNTVAVNISDGIDSTSCSWPVTVVPTCAITSPVPSNASTKISNVGTTNNFFSISTDPSCSLSWKLNGTDLGLSTSSVTLQSQLMNSGTNILVATASNGLSTVTRSWTVVKNTPPACGTLTPASSGNTAGVGSPINLRVDASDANGDALNFTWTANGTAVNLAQFAISSPGSGSSQAQFTPTVTYAGSNTISAVVNDGTDSVTCSWTVNVLNNCSLSSFSPVSSTPKVSSVGTTQTTFNVNPNDSSCAVAWQLNGATRPETTQALTLPSSDLAAGNNTLTATLTNATSTVTKTWQVKKNSPPACASQSPAAAGNTINVGGSLTLVATTTDNDSDVLTYNWLSNGTAVNPAQFTVTSPGANQSQAIFVPTLSYAGSNTIIANISDGIDSASCSWAATVVNNCSLTGVSPAAAITVANLGSTSTPFVASPNSGCTLSWTLNGATLGSTASIQNILSSSLLTGNNSLIATATNGLSTIQHLWTITRNSPPVCTSQSPSGSTSIGVGASVTLRGNVSDADGQTLTYSWLSNGATANPAQFVTTGTPTYGQAVFTPNSSYVGNNTVNLVINDGYDSTTCSWPVNVAVNCAVSSSNPSVSTTRISASGATSTFTVVPNDSSCLVNWTLNGVALGSGPSSFNNITSSQLNSGSNTLVATLANGIGTSTTQTWSLLKNRPPTCSLQTALPLPASNMLYTDTKTFSAAVSDSDGDAMVSFTWQYNGGTSTSLFPPGQISSNSSSSQAVFTPTLGEVGSNRLISVVFSDGYDSGSCQWNEEIADPNSVLSINSCNPTPYTTTIGTPPANNSAIVLANSGNNNFNINASGTLLTYQWKMNGTPLSGATSSSYSLAYATIPDLTQGFSTLTATVTDTYNTSATCVFRVKKNYIPVISSATPDNSTTIKMNSASTQVFSITATDANSDALTYAWTVDSLVQPAFLPSGSASSTFSPNSQSTMLGNHTIRVTVTDTSGAQVSTSWNVNVNQFSAVCNSLTPGTMCTLAGGPGIGNNLVPSADQTKIRVTPEYVIDDGAGNIFFTDPNNHIVGFLNRSGSTVTRLGMSITAGQLKILVGNGAAGRTEENLGYTYTQNKLNTPRGLAYDAAGDRLWIADNANHRVVLLTNTGTFSTVFGICGASTACSSTQSLAANTDGSPGTSHVCGSPNGLWYDGTSNLYIACTGSYSIKRLDLSSNNGYMVVGQLTAGSTAQVNPPTDGTVGPSGTGQNYAPYDIKGDPYRSILYTTDAVSGAANRVRVINLTGSPLTYFNDPSGVATLSLADSRVTPLTAPAGFSTSMTSSSNSTPSSVQWIAPTNMVTGNCYAASIVIRDGSGNVINTNSAFAFNLNLGSGASGTFYTDNRCTTGAATTLAGSIAVGASSFNFSFAPSAAYSAKTLTLTRTSGANPTIPTLTHTVASTATATNLALIGASTLPNGSCQQYAIQSTNASGIAANAGVLRTVAIDDGGQPGTFYSDSTCATVLASVTIGGITYPAANLPAAGDSVVFYYRKPTTVTIPSNSIGTLVGGSFNDTTVDSVNQLRLGQAYGLVPWFATGGAHALQGIFVTSSTRHVVSFINTTTADITLGGARIRSLESGYPIGIYNNGSFNGDDFGYLTRLNTPRGIALNTSTNNELLVGDMGNSRMRTLDLSLSSGQSSTILGAGYRRSGFVTDTALPAPQILLNQPSHLYYSATDNILYFSDANNFRVRGIDLSTGMVTTSIGTAQGGDGSVETQDPLAVLMRQPQGVTLYGTSLLYMDYSTNNCVLRAYNPTSSRVNIFNGLVSLFGNTVSTVGGNLSVGCVSWSAAPANVDGTSALSNHFNNNDALITDGTNVYFSSVSDHCVQKMDSTGKLYQYLGLCGTSAYADGLANAGVRLSFPLGLALDPSYPGNFFLVDQWSAISRIRYVNLMTSTLSISGVTIPAAVAGSYAGGSVIPYVKTLYSGTANGIQRWNQVAAFDKWICFSGGQAPQTALWAGNSDSGSHNIICKDRTNTNTLRFGLDETVNAITTRGGATLGTEQEGINPALLSGNTARFYGPYGLVFDSAGNLYIAERGNHVIRMISRWW